MVIKHYHKLISICIKHIRASHLTLDMLLERAKIRLASIEGNDLSHIHAA